MGIRAVIFDIDGVLADSREAVMANTRQLMEEFGFRVKEGELARMSSAHSADSVLLALAPSLADKPMKMRAMLHRLSELTAENIALVRPLPLAALIPKFAEKYLLGAATNRKASARMVLAHLGVEKHFSAVATSADAPPKPHPGMLLFSCGLLGVQPGDVIFVGDNAEDEAAGEAAGTMVRMLDGRDNAQVERFARELLG